MGGKLTEPLVPRHRGRYTRLCEEAKVFQPGADMGLCTDTGYAAKGDCRPIACQVLGGSGTRGIGILMDKWSPSAL